MHVEARLFEFLTAFFFVAAIVYVILSHEPAGSAALFLTGGLSLIIGTYFRFVARRLEERPEDDPDAEVSDGAGDVGFFSPGSYWPITLAFAAALVGPLARVLLHLGAGDLRRAADRRDRRPGLRVPPAAVGPLRPDRWSDRVCTRAT